MTDPKPRTLSPRETACVMMHRALRRGELAASDLRPWQRQACVRLADAGACHVRRDAAGIIYYLDTDND